MESTLRSMLSGLFPNMAAVKIAEISTALIAAGVEQEDDLKWLTENDIKHLLPIIQVRKFIALIQSKGECSTAAVTPVSITPPLTAEHADDSLSTTPSVSSSRLMDCTTPNATPRSTNDVDWCENFVIPWEKCSSLLLPALQEDKPPSASDLRELIGHTMSDIFQHTRRPSRDIMRRIARKIVNRYPKSFADYINGRAVSDGINSLMLMLEAKKENLNRRINFSPEGTREQSRPLCEKNAKVRRSMQYGCVSWAPKMQRDGTEEAMERKRVRLCEIFETHDIDIFEVEQLMDETYPYQRDLINKMLPVGEVLNRWPFLGSYRLLLNHCMQLTGVDVEPRLRAAVSISYPDVHNFMMVNAKSVMEPFCSMSMPEPEKLLIMMMMAYFREPEQHMIQFMPVCKTIIE